MFTSKEDNLSGYIIYINDITNEFQYKDPKLIEILNNVKEKYNQIKYTTYRCSAKLLALKKALYTHYIPYTTVVSSIIERHGFNQIDTIECITPSQLTALIHDIFYASQKFHYFKNYPNFKLQSSIEILSNFFWNIFDPNRNQSISILELKQTLLILCDTNSFEQIIYEHFLLNADHNRCVTQFRFESMIKILSKLFSYIDDDHDVGGDNHNNIRNLYYRPNRISEIVHECFQQCPGIVGLNEYQFHCLWKKSTIKFSCYSNVFDLIKRLNNSQQILHNVECTACQTIPIRGLRFKCQHCKTLSLCFNCFCVGYANHHHELSHRMYEISSIEISPNKLRTFLSKLCYIFTRNNSMDQLSSNMTLETKLVNDIDENTLQTNSREYGPINNVAVNDEIVCTDPNCGGGRGDDDDDDDIVDDQQMKLNTLYTSQLSNGSEIIRIISNNNNNNNNNYNNNININNNINNNYKHNNNNNNYIPEKLMKIIEMLTEENITLQNKLENNLNNNKKDNNNKKLLKFFENNQAASLKKLSFNKYLESHIINLTDAINQLRCIWQHSISLQLPYASTPLRRNSCKRATDLYSPLSRSIHGSEINKTFLENNKSDLTVGDISSWYLDKQSLTSNKRDNNCDKLQILCETDMANNIDTEMNNFKLLIQRVKEIIDDSYSDNFELSQATNRLEKVLDRIIDEEEKKRNEELNVFF